MYVYEHTTLNLKGLNENYCVANRHMFYTLKASCSSISIKITDSSPKDLLLGTS